MFSSVMFFLIGWSQFAQKTFLSNHTGTMKFKLLLASQHPFLHPCPCFRADDFGGSAAELPAQEERRVQGRKWCTPPQVLAHGGEDRGAGPGRGVRADPRCLRLNGRRGQAGPRHSGAGRDRRRKGRARPPGGAAAAGRGRGRVGRAGAAAGRGRACCPAAPGSAARVVPGMGVGLRPRPGGWR